MRSAEDKATYYLVIARDTGIGSGKASCIRCGKLASDVHEILPRSFFGPSRQDELFDIKNRCCLCRKCHSEVHNDDGRAELLRILHKRYGYQYDGRAKCLLSKEPNTGK